ncbi:hypothetical protein [Spirulina sp. 06S082]|uniref:hypothetical protein n=1 Tax=Spirulina sp. 06S082 TaxID=3110248 RepID=UPI002B1F25EE|nr:hypothetical protein [Spirulina sp. 06S082]MEA5469060.1 hypothetical protein [Spirulina sp. 06S082]
MRSHYSKKYQQCDRISPLILPKTRSPFSSHSETLRDRTGGNGSAIASYNS